MNESHTCAALDGDVVSGVRRPSVRRTRLAPAAGFYRASGPIQVVLLALAAAFVSSLHAAAAETGAHAALPADAPLFSIASLIALLTLTGLEIVLGIDNVIFISILSGKLPPATRPKAQKTGIALAVITRILLLLSLSWLMSLTKPLFPDAPWRLGLLSGKSLILIVGGLFLVGKAAYELHEKLEVEDHAEGGGKARAAASLATVIAQIIMIDIVFSLDSVITAVGMSNQIPVMIAAVVLAAIVMIVFARPISDFVEHHPTLKVLALSFLLLIGVMLFVEGFVYQVPKGYICFAMFFALAVEFLNMRLRRKAEKVKLRYSHLP